MNTNSNIENNSVNKIIETVWTKHINHQLKRSILIIIPFIFIGPYFPGKRGNENLNDLVGYWWAVIILTIGFIAALIYAKIVNDVKLEQKLKDIENSYTVKTDTLEYITTIKNFIKYDTLVFKNPLNKTINLNQTNSEIKSVLKKNKVFRVQYLEDEKLILKIEQ